MITIEQLKKEFDELKQDFKQHTHDRTNSFAIFLKDQKGFPIFQVADASVAPSFSTSTGQIIFQVDPNPDYYLWAYLLGSDGLNHWVGVALT